MKILKTLLVLVSVIVALILISWIAWSIKPKQEVDLLVLNKTTTSPDRAEHASLFWLLNHQRYCKCDHKTYEAERDYFGFHPLKPYSDKKYDMKRVPITRIDSMVNRFDGVYFADTYGVSFGEWFKGQPHDRSTIIEGGLSNSDYSLMKAMKDKGKLIIAEYNILAPPTMGLYRMKTEELLSIKWTGWRGKAVKQLDAEKTEEIPDRYMSWYNNLHDEPWDFNGPGVVLVHERDKKCLVLTESHLEGALVPQISLTPYGKQHFDSDDEVYFSNWFEITFPTEGQVIAEYNLEVNTMGEELLSTWGIPEHFPAVIENKASAPFYYFCGDFTQNPVMDFTAKLRGSAKLHKLLSSNKPFSQKGFYWNFYYPLMNQILKDYRGQLEPGAET